MIKTETDKPNISYSNVIEAMDAHGKIVGAIHAVVPFENMEENSTEKFVIKNVTQIFFSDGFCHTAFGFAVGKNEKEEHIAKLVGLAAILNIIPGVAPLLEETLMDLSNTKEEIEQLEDGKTLYFLFQIPEHAIIASVLTLPGWVALTNCIELLEEDNNIREVVC